MFFKNTVKKDTIGWLDVALWLISAFLILGLTQTVGVKKQSKPLSFKKPISSCSLSIRVDERMLDGGYQHLIYMVHDRDISHCVHEIEKHGIHYAFLQKESQLWRVHVAIDHTSPYGSKKRRPEHSFQQKKCNNPRRKAILR